MHIIDEASYENIFESEQSQLFDSLREEKIVYSVPSAAKLFRPRLGILEWLGENLNNQNYEKNVRGPLNWINTDPRTVEVQFK